LPVVAQCVILPLCYSTAVQHVTRHVHSITHAEEHETPLYLCNTPCNPPGGDGVYGKTCVHVDNNSKPSNASFRVQFSSSSSSKSARPATASAAQTSAASSPPSAAFPDCHHLQTAAARRCQLSAAASLSAASWASATSLSSAACSSPQACPPALPPVLCCHQAFATAAVGSSLRLVLRHTARSSPPAALHCRQLLSTATKLFATQCSPPPAHRRYPPLGRHRLAVCSAAPPAASTTRAHCKHTVHVWLCL
jgi:hypothetical protein